MNSECFQIFSPAHKQELLLSRSINTSIRQNLNWSTAAVASPQTHITPSSSEGAEILMLGLQQHWSFKSCDLKVYIWCHRHGPRLKVTSSTAICPLRPILRSALSSTCTHTHPSSSASQTQLSNKFGSCTSASPCPESVLSRWHACVSNHAHLSYSRGRGHTCSSKKCYRGDSSRS